METKEINGAPRTWAEKRQDVADAQRIEYIKAMVAVAAGVQNPHADAINGAVPGGRAKYASLTAVRNAIVPIAAKHGLAISQAAMMTHARGVGEAEGEAHVVVVTTISHVAGYVHTERGVPIPAMGRTGLTAHSVKSADTYGRRIALSGIFCLGTDDDDDGNAVTSSTWKKTEKAEKAVEWAKAAPTVSKWPREGDDVSYEAPAGGAR